MREFSRPSRDRLKRVGAGVGIAVSFFVLMLFAVADLSGVVSDIAVITVFASYSVLFTDIRENSRDLARFTFGLAAVSILLGLTQVPGTVQSIMDGLAMQTAVFVFLAEILQFGDEIFLSLFALVYFIPRTGFDTLTDRVTVGAQTMSVVAVTQAVSDIGYTVTKVLGQHDDASRVAGESSFELFLATPLGAASGFLAMGVLTWVSILVMLYAIEFITQYIEGGNAGSRLATGAFVVVLVGALVASGTVAVTHTQQVDESSESNYTPEDHYTDVPSFNDGEYGPVFDSEFHSVGEFESGNGVLACSEPTAPPEDVGVHTAAHVEYVELPVAPVLVDGGVVPGRYVVDTSEIPDDGALFYAAEYRVLDSADEYDFASGPSSDVDKEHVELVYAEQVDSGILYWESVNDDGEVVRHYTNICPGTAGGDVDE